MKNGKKRKYKKDTQFCKNITINLYTRETGTCGQKLSELFTPYAKELFTPNYCFECEAFANNEDK